MAVRLLVITHAPTVRARELIAGDESDVAEPDRIGPLERRVAAWFCGPEPACAQTARRLGGEPRVMPVLAGPDLGAWRGHGLMELGGDPAVRDWTADPRVVPPGGESLAAAMTRMSAWADDLAVDGLTAAVVTPLAGRALLAGALGGPPELALRLDLEPLAAAELSRGPVGWRLRFRRLELAAG